METETQMADQPSDSVYPEQQPIEALPGIVDVLVVGFGPVGATVANLLGRYGLRVLVIDKATDIFMAPRYRTRFG